MQHLRFHLRDFALIVANGITRPMLRKRKGIVADDDGGDVGGGADDAAVQGRDALAPWPTH